MAVLVWFKSRVLLLVMSLLLQGCVTSVVVKGTVPTPLVGKIPARIGIYYSEEFQKFKHEEVIRDSGGWTVDLGMQNLVFFKNLTQALFAEVQEIQEPILDSIARDSLDGILIPSIIKYGFLTPSVSGLKFYSASIEYKIEMINKSGRKIGDWSIVGYGKSEGGIFSADAAVNEATVLAIRDGGARIAIGLKDQAVIQKWLNSLQKPAQAIELNDETAADSVRVDRRERVGSVPDA